MAAHLELMVEYSVTHLVDLDSKLVFSLLGHFVKV